MQYIDVISVLTHVEFVLIKDRWEIIEKECGRDN